MSSGDDDATRVPDAERARAQVAVDGASALPVGFMLVEFRIESVLGEGGFGIVYLARDVRLERLVAVKEYMPSSLASRQPDWRVTVRSERHRETFELGRRSFINEARLLAHFDHPALVKVLRFWEDRGTAYMAMPYYRGRTLKQYLQQTDEPPAEAWLRSLLGPLLDALEHLHAHDVLHRDIAPDNIVLLPSGAPLLLDFGAARHVIGGATQALTVILKQGYAPIEQYAETGSLKQGPWSDVYALAAVMYAAISGRAPQPSVARVMHDDVLPAVVAGRGRYDDAFLRWIDACLAVRPADRPQNVAAMRRLLESTAAAQPAATLEHDDDRTIAMPAAPRTSSGQPAAPTAAAPAGQATVAPPPVEWLRLSDDERRPVPAPRDAAGSRGKAVAMAAIAAVAVAVAVALAWWLASPGRPDSAPAVAANPPNPAAPAPSEPPLPKAATPSDAPPRAGPGPSPALPGLPAARTAYEMLDRLVAGHSAAIEVRLRASAQTYALQRDRVGMSIYSEVAGYVYLWSAAADEAYLELLFPNATDAHNRIDARTTLQLPRKNWDIEARPPAGERRVVALVSPQPRDFSKVGLEAGLPFARIAWSQADAATWAAGGQAVCDNASGPCDASYGAAQASFSVIEPPAVEAAPPQTTRKPPVTTAPPPPRDARAATGNQSPQQATAAECGALLQRLSLGDDSPALRARLASAHCK